MPTPPNRILVTLELLVKWGNRYIETAPGHQEGDFSLELSLSEFDELKKYGADYGNAA